MQTATVAETYQTLTAREAYERGYLNFTSGTEGRGAVGDQVTFMTTGGITGDIAKYYQYTIVKGLRGYEGEGRTFTIERKHFSVPGIAEGLDFNPQCSYLYVDLDKAPKFLFINGKFVGVAGNSSDSFLLKIRWINIGDDLIPENIKETTLFNPAFGFINTPWVTLGGEYKAVLSNTDLNPTYIIKENQTSFFQVFGTHQILRDRDEDSSTYNWYYGYERTPLNFVIRPYDPEDPTNPHKKGLPIFPDPEQGDDWLMNITPSSENEFTVTNALSKILILSEAQIENLFNNLLFSNNSSVIDAVLDGLKLYGQNPADCIIDLYQIPFHPPTSGLATAVDKTKLAIGTEEVTLGRFDEIQKVTTKSLGTIDLSTSINPNFPIFGDWRDYLSYGLYIYLPYAGIYSLNPEKYIGHKISLKVMFDVRTGNFKYYVFSDSLVTDMFEGACRMNCPVTSSNKEAAANMFKSSVGSMIQSAQMAVRGATGIASGSAVTGAIDIAGAAAGIGMGVAALSAPVPLSVSGGFSGSSNIFDDTQAKLIQIYQPYDYDNNIVNNLGMEDNKFMSLANITGYVEVEDVRLVSGRSKRMQDLCKQCLAEGCIL